MLIKPYICVQIHPSVHVYLLNYSVIHSSIESFGQIISVIAV